MLHRLTTIISGDEELLLGEYDDFYKAVECAEKFKEYYTFRICEEDNCLVGIRMHPGDHAIFWRIPRNGETRNGHTRGRDNRVMDILDRVISVFKR